MIGHYNSKISLCALLVISVLSACASQPIGTQTEVNSSAHLARLAQLSDWQAKGKASVTSPEQSLTLNVHWQQRGDTLVVDISGPLGQGSGQLSGQPGAYRLRSPQGEFFADSLNQFSRQLMGSDLPLDSLRWWLLGMPDPDLAHSLSFNALGLVDELTQAGWQLGFSRYQGETLPLPGRIDLQQLNDQGNKARVVVTQWQP